MGHHQAIGLIRGLKALLLQLGDTCALKTVSRDDADLRIRVGQRPRLLCEIANYLPKGAELWRRVVPLR
jgi:hypothetical protein